jgi:hypothetical protein
MALNHSIERYTRPGHGSVNCYILSSTSGMALIDTQSTLPEARELRERLAKVGNSLEAICQGAT